MPFGLCNAPAVFQRFINAVFADPIAKNIVLTYLDDLIIPSRTMEEGTERLQIVLSVAARAGLKINWSKCKFLQKKIEYLGQVLENGTVSPSESKVKAVVKFPDPKCARDIQSFLGLAGYFRKFVLGYAKIARPLSNLLRKNVKFDFGEEEKRAFVALKNKLITLPILQLYKQDAETELHTDASKHGFGAILMQKNSDDNKFHPVFYASGKTTPAEEKYISYELEVLAIVKALNKFRIYLLGIPFIIVTDCQAFTMTMNKKICVYVLPDGHFCWRNSGIKSNIVQVKT
jgi:Reverse transcriptase (RNA-dependent DNA polymerase).